MKKKGLLFTVMILVFILIFGLTGAEKALAVEPIILKYADPSKSGTSRTKAAEDTMHEIEKRTGGRVKHEFYWSESLLKGRDVFKGVQMGTADIGLTMGPMYNPSHFPVWQFIQLVFIGGYDQYGVVKACNELYGTNPLLKKEFEEKGIKFLNGSGVRTMIISRVPLREKEDFKGVRVRALGGMAKWVAAMGGVPNPMIFHESMEAFARGTLDADMSAFYLIHGYKEYQYCKYLPLDPVVHFLVDYAINLDTLNKMPPDVQKIYLDTWRDFYLERTVKHYDDEEQMQISDIKKAGVNMYNLTPNQLAKWKEAAFSQHEDYYKNMEKMGIDGRKIVAEYQALYNKYERKR